MTQLLLRSSKRSMSSEDYTEWKGIIRVNFVSQRLNGAKFYVPETVLFTCNYTDGTYITIGSLLFVAHLSNFHLENKILRIGCIIVHAITFLTALAYPPKPISCC